LAADRQTFARPINSATLIPPASAILASVE
jgi:hypothetical protein